LAFHSVVPAMATEITPEVCADELNEADLQRACAPLYGPIAVDAVANLLLVCFFTYIALLMHVENTVQEPVKAVFRIVFKFVRDYLKELGKTIATIPQMGKLPLGARLRCCSNIDKAVSLVSAVVPLIAITRLMNFGNVNGMRWLGYSLTCPFMQLELVMLVAPVVPLVRLNMIIAFLITFGSLFIGWVTSVMRGPLYNGTLGAYVDTFETADLDPTVKGNIAAWSFIGIAVLSLFQLPFLGLLYFCGKHSKSKDDLPDGYLTLLLSIVVTWWLFPAWWFFSWEGAAFFKDAKLNEMGFTVLNLMAKGSFIYQTNRMDKTYSKKFPAQVDAMIKSVDIPEVLRQSYNLRQKNASQIINALTQYDSQYDKSCKTQEDPQDAMQQAASDLIKFESNDKQGDGTTSFAGLFTASPTVASATAARKQDDRIQHLTDTILAIRYEIDMMKRGPVEQSTTPSVDAGGVRTPPRGRQGDSPKLLAALPGHDALSPREGPSFGATDECRTQLEQQGKSCGSGGPEPQQAPMVWDPATCSYVQTKLLAF